MTPLKTAVVGVGSLGRHHARWLHQLAPSELIGVYDIERDKADSLAREFGVTAFDNLDQVAAAAEMVSVVVPTTAHFKVASFLIERGAHCLIEKPITPIAAEASRLAELAREKGVKVTVGQIERFNPAVQALAGINVRPSFVEAHRLAPFDPRGTDVAVVLDLMIHDIDLVLHFIKSQVVDIQASAVAVVSDEADIANARLTFENGAVANLTASRISLSAMRKLRFFQKSGYFSLDLAKKQADLYYLDNGDAIEGMRIPLGKSGKNVVYRKVTDSGEDMLAAELKHFLEAIGHDRPVAVSLNEAVSALSVALDVKRIGTDAIQRVIAATPE
jgi:predicted dehydrogenase